MSGSPLVWNGQMSTRRASGLCPSTGMTWRRAHTVFNKSIVLVSLFVGNVISWKPAARRLREMKKLISKISNALRWTFAVPVCFCTRANHGQEENNVNEKEEERKGEKL